MRKSGFAAAAGIGSLALLLTACGGSSGSSSSTSTSAPASTSTSTGQPAPQGTAGALGVTPGSTVLHVQKSAIGYVLAMGNGQVVYMYDKDKGGKPSCTGACAQTWIPVTGSKPAASPADTGLGAFTTVANGSVTQVVYDGHPLYTLKGAKALTTAGNGQGGEWHVIKLSASNVVSG
jgi:predicted lipoprotein with Yx(FWY)xxD motif